MSQCEGGSQIRSADACKRCLTAQGAEETRITGSIRSVAAGRKRASVAVYNFQDVVV